MDDAISPIDGRYRDDVSELAAYVSEQALQRKRVAVECRYLLALADADGVPLTLSDEERERVADIHRDFDDSDFERIRDLEAARKHDVAAVIDFVKEEVPAGAAYVHLGLTSEDVTNLAFASLLRDAVDEVLLPALEELGDVLADRADTWADAAMLGRTHGQPATPTTVGKELAVALDRVRRQRDALDELQLTGKLGGATGTFSAHDAAFPDVDWSAFAERFVLSLGLDPVGPTTQVKPRDDLADLCYRLATVNGVVLDLARDCWHYTSYGYFVKELGDEEVGSSTMPQKANPIDFENAEGNLDKAINDLQFLAQRLQTSRMQRDLSDSTLRRNVGAALAHTLLAWKRARIGLEKVDVDRDALGDDLNAHPEVLSEALQVASRASGHAEALDEVKRRLAEEDVADLIEDVPLDDAVRERLRAIEPADYTGEAAWLARDAVERWHGR